MLFRSYSCHGSALGDDKPPAATTHATTHADCHATDSGDRLARPLFRGVEHSIQDLEVLADTKLLRDIRTAGVHGAAAERCESTGGPLARRVSGLAPGTEWDGAMRSCGGTEGVRLWWSFRE